MITSHKRKLDKLQSAHINKKSKLEHAKLSVKHIQERIAEKRLSERDPSEKSDDDHPKKQDDDSSDVDDDRSESVWAGKCSTQLKKHTRTFFKTQNSILAS